MRLDGSRLHGGGGGVFDAICASAFPDCRHDWGGVMVACILTARITGAVSMWVRPSRAAISPVMYS